jgi:SAM-dependent methyltransferase
VGVDDVRARWDAEAETFDQESDHGLTEPATRDAWRRLLSSVLPLPPAKVADLGSGTGSISILLAEHGYRVSGVDLSPRMVELATAKAALYRVSIPFAVGDAARPDLKAGEFDVVLARHVVWALPDPGAALNRWVGLLAPLGRLVLVEGDWSTGAGISATRLTDLIRPMVKTVRVLPLTDVDLWGRAIEDERYLLLATT